MIENLINFLNRFPPEAIWILMALFCFAAVLGMLRLFGPAGLYVYIAVAVVGANIQVLKAVQFSVYSDPVALGTILFATTYLCTDILSEYYGQRLAAKGVLIGFAAGILMTGFMLLTLSFRPLSPQEAGESMEWALTNHEHMAALFIPAPALLTAGMTAYLVSQFHDIWCYNFFKKLTRGRFLWLRNNGSTWLSALIDNTVFSVLAWIVLTENPLPWKVVVFTYILGTYWLRLLVALFDTPVLYLARYFLPAGEGTQTRAAPETESITR